ncbi:MAG TPA: phospho-sugar mutase [Rhabdochlamydiaceae bacterium]|nr:phospho-sugar mutase [Rhabdochlamydiaceae bacterium]
MNNSLNSFPPDVQNRIKQWLEPPFDRATQEAVQQMIKTNPKDLLDAFSSTLGFGTGGMRALMGPGTTRMNIYTVRLATQGLANYIRKQSKAKERHTVFISYDSRHHSELFAHEAASVLAGNGIAVLLTREIRPTPYVSFGLRHDECIAGIMITASHNPKEYNGYKVYWSDGGQVVPPHDQGIIAEVNAISSLDQVHSAPLTSPLITLVELSLDLDYLAAIHKVQLNIAENKRVGNSLKITYTPVHGTGIKLVPRALKDWGFSNINLVGAQSVIDGNFPTVKVPNPEYAETLHLGVEQLMNSGSDILLATDPDADRVAVATMHHGKAYILNGNEIASICVEYICQTLTEQKKMPKNGAVVTTIVSTDMIRTICKAYGCSCIEVLTGFKYIGECIHKWELSHEHKFLFGAEESYGYLIGTHSRDKDAVVSACLLAEIALFMKVEGRTLLDFLYDIYKKYGIFREKQLTVDFPGQQEKIRAAMQKLRANPPKTILNEKVAVLEDYQKGFNGLPKSDVLLFRLEDESKLVVRPSGTEPKLKIYAGVRLKSFPSLQEGIVQCDQKLDLLLKEMHAQF